MESALLSEALFKTSSLIKNFLSQAGDDSKGKALDGMFSTLLSGGAAANDGAVCSARGSVSSDVAPDFSPSSANGNWTQTLADLKATLNRASALLKQKTAAGKHAADAQERKPMTPKETASAQTGQAENNQAAQTQQNETTPTTTGADQSSQAARAAAAVAVEEDIQSSEDAELSEILAALLALMQLVMQALLQMQQAGSGDAQREALSDTSALLEGSEGAEVSGTDAKKADGQSSLWDLLKAVEKNVQSLMDSDKAEAAAETDGTLAGVLEQLAQLDSRMEEVVSLLHPAQGTKAPLAAQAGLIAPLQDNAKAPSALLLTATENGSAGLTPSIANKGAVSLNAFGDMGSDPDLGTGGKTFSFTGNNASFGANVSPEGAQATGTYSFASTLSAFRAVNGGAAGLPSVVDQVVIHLNRGVKEGQSHVTVQLQPGDLGKITVKLDFDAEGKVQGTVTADNPKTLEMLQKDSRSLERALQDAGLRADPGSLQFNLRQGDQNSAEHADAFANYAPGGILPVEGDASETPLVDVGALAETYYLTPTGVNIRV